MRRVDLLGVGHGWSPRRPEAIGVVLALIANGVFILYFGILIDILDAVGAAEISPQRPGLTGFSRDYDHAIGPPQTVQGRSRAAFQDVDAFHVVGIDVRRTVGHSP